jgi:hypothetical protein
VNWEEDSFRILIGIAEATALDDFSGSFLLSSGEGDMPIPAGVEMLSENIKSSRFIASECSAGCAFVGVWSDDFLGCAIPLGALLAAIFAEFSLNNLVERS